MTVIPNLSGADHRFLTPDFTNLVSIVFSLGLLTSIFFVVSCSLTGYQSFFNELSIFLPGIFQLLLLATTSVALAADTEKEVQPELKSAESALPIRVHDDERRYRFEDGLELIRSRDEHSRLRVDDYRDSRRNDYRDGRDGRQGPVRIDFKEEDNAGPLILRSPHPLPSHVSCRSSLNGEN